MSNRPNTRRRTSLAASLAITLLASCAAGSTATEEIPAFEPAIPAASINLALCTGRTPSDDPAQISAGLDGLAAALRALPLPESGEVGQRPPVTGVELSLRRISSNALSSPGDELLRIEIPAVPGVSQPPDAADFRTFPENDAAWREAVAVSDTAAAEHLAAREQALSSLGTLALDSDSSQIAGCVTAARDSFPREARVTVVLLSDMEQVGAPQLRGDFSRVDVIVAHACVDAARCDETADAWRGVFESIGVASATFVSVGQLGSELARILEVRS